MITLQNITKNNYVSTRFFHYVKVIEMIQKRKDYPDSRIKELAKLTQKTEEEVKQDLFGTYLKEDLHKRPLSKLIKDISKELGLI